MKISDKIRYFRQQKGYSQEDMATLVGMSVTGYAKMERSNNPKVDSLAKIAEVLEISLNDLVVTNDKNVVYISQDYKGDNGSVTGLIEAQSSENLYNENEKLKMNNNFLQEKISFLEKEIENLKEINGFLREKTK